MMNALLILHLFITIALVGLVLIQRSEGGGLGLGGGGGGGSGGFMTTRGTANAMTRMTVGLATAFFVTSILLSIVAGLQRGTTGSVTDQPIQSESVTPAEEDIVPASPVEEEPESDEPQVPVGD